MRTTEGAYVQPAVLLIGFNRPDTLSETVKALANVSPKVVYAACDGPRAGHATDTVCVGAVRDIMLNLPWSCEVHTRFLNENQGCTRGVSGAIDWFFEHESEGIILEDDCVADPSFFEFASLLLEAYRENPNIGAICGSSPLRPKALPSNSYYFSRYFSAWGWATWRRAWKHYQLEQASLALSLQQSDFMGAWHSRLASKRWRNRLTGNPEWDYLWGYALWKQSMAVARPGNNLIRNIGIGPNATHTSKVPIWTNLPVETLTFPLTAPANINPDDNIDGFFEAWRYNSRPWLLRHCKKLAWKCGLLSQEHARGWHLPLRKG